MTRKPTVCKDCGKLLTEEQLSLQRNRCDICRKEKTRIDSNNRQLAKNLKKYKDRTDMLECKECGWKVEQTGNLYQHIKMHGFTKESYCEKFNCTKDDLFGKIAKIVFSEKVKGELNPAYQHGGKYSSLSKKFIKYENIDDKEKEEKIKIVSDKISDSIITNGNNSTTLLYWLKQGYSEEEAVEKLSERQTTFSKKICIEKYGEIDGLKRWEERQELWQKNLPHSNYSKISQLLFWDIYNNLPIEHQDECFFIELTNCEYRIGRFKIDFFIKSVDIAIEFWGDYWHANPNIYKETSVINGKTAIDIWNGDIIREKELLCTNPNLKIIFVWEQDYKKEPQETLEKILNEIKLIIKLKTK